MEEMQANITGDIEDNGLSLHVEGADGHEYLRFDCFSSGPHYHYIEPSGEQQTIVDFDRVALGEMLPWVLHQLGTRLDAMLEYAGGGALLSTINRAEVDRLLPEVEHLARRAESELASQKKQRR